jgi:YHS domain-containing protein
MDWLTQNWIWIVVAALALVMFRRMGHHGFGGPAHYGFGTNGDAAGADSTARSQDVGASPRGPEAAIDPVSGNALKTEHAITSFYHGRVFFFENEDTRRRFEAEPERFAAGTSGVDPQAVEQRQHRRHGC